MIKRFQLNSTEKVILCSVDTATTYKLSDIWLEYATILDECYATIGITDPLRSNIKKMLLICLFAHCKDYCCYSLINRTTSQPKMKKFTTLPSRTF